jgi:hypothetical protein
MMGVHNLPNLPTIFINLDLSIGNAKTAFLGVAIGIAIGIELLRTDPDF